MEVRPTDAGGIEGEFRLPKESAARLKALLDAYAKPRTENDDRSLRQRNADTLADLLANKITTEMLVLVNAESLPTDHPTTEDDTADADTADDTIDDTASHDAGDIDDDGDHTDDATNPSDDVDGHADKTREAGQARDASRASAAGQADAATAQATTEQVTAHAGGTSRAGNAGDGRDRLLRWKVPGLLLATGQLLSPTDIARLARTSTLMRLVMDADGQVLDMGRAVRLATGAQRKAVFARYSTCWIDGCPLPATLCQIDHADNWVEGGLTNLKLLGPACQHHNRDRYRHPERYVRRREGKDRWAYTYTGPRYRTRPRRTPTTGATTSGPPRSGDPP
ncbi:hypothetical protein Pth03_17960 [Planotetraspora thailandica]|uniref:HNH nuclease domain-containing protein n=1 Tax=Planotetraspora thailandica TaxID=487172 RepID=A0A8J3XSM8_9ACTN|nr:hypothetical protein Pth03_17960 [Planotetraspora thailandica]